MDVTEKIVQAAVRAPMKEEIYEQHSDKKAPEAKLQPPHRTWDSHRFACFLVFFFLHLPFLLIFGQVLGLGKDLGSSREIFDISNQWERISFFFLLFLFVFLLGFFFFPQRAGSQACRLSE